MGWDGSPLVWATKGSNSFEGLYPMTAPVETLFSLLTSEKTRQLGSNFCGHRLALPNTLKAFKML